VIVLSAGDCRELLDPAAILRGVEDALRMEHADTVRWSEPSSLRVRGSEGGSAVRVKACILDDPRVAGVRVLSFPSEGADTRWVLLFDATTGEPLAIVDEAWTYPHRSIASVALVAHRLATRNVGAVAIVGAGRIARAALPYVAHLFPGASVAISSRRERTRSELAREARERHGLEASPLTVETAVRGAQVVLSCTNATAPVVHDAWVGPGTALGFLETRECEPALFANADLRVVDSREQLRDELAEAFGPRAPLTVDGTMADVVAGAHPGRTDDDQRVVVVSQGLVSQDVLLAFRAYRDAVRRGVGRPFPPDALGGSPG
jgi:ornithine cyclodeaminase/alanine dehydrogenase-like protein (mu-crystallin family)